MQSSLAMFAVVLFVAATVVSAVPRGRDGSCDCGRFLPKVKVTVVQSKGLTCAVRESVD
jgi:hypothetical protein